MVSISIHLRYVLYRILYRFNHWWYLARLQDLVIVNSTVMDMGMQISLWSADFDSFGYNPSSDLAGSCSSIFKDFRAFFGALISLYPHKQLWGVLYCPSLAASVGFAFFDWWDSWIVPVFLGQRVTNSSLWATRCDLGGSTAVSPQYSLYHLVSWSLFSRRFFRKAQGSSIHHAVPWGLCDLYPLFFNVKYLGDSSYTWVGYKWHSYSCCTVNSISQLTNTWQQLVVISL